MFNLDAFLYNWNAIGKTIAVNVPLAVVALGGLTCSQTGCTGFEPGPQAHQVSTVPSPIGTFVLSGERDFNLHARGVVGVPGSASPSIEELTISRNASMPIRTRADAALAIELQRQQFTERLLMQIVEIGFRGATAYQEAQAAKPPPTPSQSRAEQIREIAQILKEIGVVPPPATQPSP